MQKVIYVPYQPPDKTPKPSVLNQSLLFWLWQTNHAWQKQIKIALKPFNISYVECLILWSLAEDFKNGKTYTQKHLLRHVGVNKMRLSRTLHSLKRKDMIKILPPGVSINRKQTPIFVSSKGRKALSDIKKAVDETENSLQRDKPDSKRSLKITPQTKDITY